MVSTAAHIDKRFRGKWVIAPYKNKRLYKRLINSAGGNFLLPCIWEALSKNKTHTNSLSDAAVLSSFQNNIIVRGAFKVQRSTLQLDVNLPPKQLVTLNRSFSLRRWHVWAQKLQTEQSAFQTITPQMTKRHCSVESVWLGVFLLCLLTFWQRSAVCGWMLFTQWALFSWRASLRSLTELCGRMWEPRKQPSIPDTRPPLPPPPHVLSLSSHGYKNFACA